jgi:hypothetical protein
MKLADYIDATPAAAKLRDIQAAGVALTRLATIIPIPLNTLHLLVRRRQKLIRPEHAAIIDRLDINELRDMFTVRVDDEILTGITLGLPVTIPYGQKAHYARELHARGWAFTRICRTLRMSGATVHKALDAEVAA